MLKKNVRTRLAMWLMASVMSATVMFAPVSAFASDDTSATETTTEATTETTDSGDILENVETGSVTDSQTDAVSTEGNFMEYVAIPEPTQSEGVNKFFDTLGGKVIGFLLKLLSVGMLVSVMFDLCFVGVSFTQGMFLSLERSGITLISNEAHMCAGVPKATPQGQNGRSGGGYGGGYGGMDDMGGGYDMGGGGRNNQQNQQASGIKGYIKSSLAKLILVTAFAVLMLSGVYIHVGYALGSAVSNALGRI